MGGSIVYGLRFRLFAFADGCVGEASSLYLCQLLAYLATSNCLLRFAGAINGRRWLAWHFSFRCEMLWGSFPVWKRECWSNISNVLERPLPEFSKQQNCPQSYWVSFNFSKFSYEIVKRWQRHTHCAQLLEPSTAEIFRQGKKSTDQPFSSWVCVCVLEGVCVCGCVFVRVDGKWQFRLVKSTKASDKHHGTRRYMLRMWPPIQTIGMFEPFHQDFRAKSQSKCRHNIVGQTQ